jgi:hypothetical protein
MGIMSGIYTRKTKELPEIPFRLLQAINRYRSIKNIVTLEKELKESREDIPV